MKAYVITSGVIFGLLTLCNGGRHQHSAGPVVRLHHRGCRFFVCLGGAAALHFVTLVKSLNKGSEVRHYSILQWYTARATLLDHLVSSRL